MRELTDNEIELMDRRGIIPDLQLSGCNPRVQGGTKLASNKIVRTGHTSAQHMGGLRRPAFFQRGRAASTR